MRYLATWMTPVGVALILAACSSGHSGQSVPPPPPAATTLNGAVVDGPVSGATVNAYEVTAAGTAGTLIGGPVTTSTDGKGSYTLNLNLQTLGTYNGPILLQATSGTYLDDVTGQSVDLAKAGLTLSALIPPPTVGWSAAGTVATSVTPLSTIAANVGLGQIADGTSADSAATAASTANAAIATYFGGLSNLLTTTVLDLSQAGCSASAAQASIDESVVIAAISQLAASAGVSTPNLEAALISDVVADGIIDGTANGIAIPVALNAGGTIDLTAIIGTKGLAAALQTAAAAFTASNADACKAPESSALATALSGAPTPNISAPRTSYTLTGTASGLPAGGSVQVKFNLLLNSAATGGGTANFQYFVTANGAFTETLNTLYASSDISGWQQSVQSQPAAYQCTLSPSSGAFSGDAISGVNLACTAPTYTVGGSVTGLTASGLQLLLNGAGALPVSANATTFTFPGLATGTVYAVSVGTSPAGLTCTVNAATASGIVAGTNVSNVQVACTPLTVSVTESVLHSFKNSSVDGGVPYGNLIQGSDGNFYGTTQVGGTNSTGTVFKITPAGVESVLYSFGVPPDGQGPNAGLIQGSDGNFYGTTNAGGTNGAGTVFKVTPAGVESVLYSAFAIRGAGPSAGLIQGSDGNFYGTTYADGANSAGTVFKITPAGDESVLYSFGAFPDGSGPSAGLIQGSDGNFYGTTSSGGTNITGTVFKLTPAGAETVLHSFKGIADGARPVASLIQGNDGNFYGTTEGAGGDKNAGTIFKITPAGVESVLYFFGAPPDGQAPSASLVQASDGNFYGTTNVGGTNGTGAVFMLTPAGTETVLYSFGTASGTDGLHPQGGLIQGSDGAFYGTTFEGGAFGFGTVFKIN